MYGTSTDSTGETVQTLESYVKGGWQAPTGTGRPYFNAVTGAQIGTISSAGVDFAEVVAHGREVGGPVLRGLTIHERAALLKQVGLLLLSDEVKEPLYELSMMTGATRRDSWIDIDGGASVLLTYSSKARRELPNSNVVVEGPTEILSRDGSFLATHILTPRLGVAVQINAFNFPVWGMLEKLAPAFVAGVPSIVKPAGQTAFLTEAAVRIIIDSGLLPDGSLQLICGTVGDLFDHLSGQDSVAFTGSAATAHLLRNHPTIVANSVRFNTEADSLNAAILSSSAGPGTPEFDLFVAEVVNEMTTKAGQKCTAIRRALVPAQYLDAVGEAIVDSLGKVRVGDPADPDVTMGSLASMDQRSEVNRAIEVLSEATTPLLNSCEFVGVDPQAGAFVPPTLLVATDPAAPVLHATEAFGPVSTLMGYRSPGEAIDLVVLGQGSLVASVFSRDPDEVRELALGIAPHHGRLLVVDESMAKASTGHGSPLPHLVHGGPGRAGGGEEMGGIRGVHHHMQRTAVQGSPDMLTAVIGEWLPGASRRTDKGHPFTLYFEDLEIGDAVETETRTVTLEDIEDFAHSTGDNFYAHMDDEAAKANPIFDGRVAHGYLVLSLAAGLFVWPDVGPVLANYGIDKLRFATPTYPGDEIRVNLTCKRKTLLAGRGYGEVAWDAEVINQKGEVAAAYDVLTLVANRPGINGAE